MSDLPTNPNKENPLIGYVTGGGLEANLQVRLEVPAHEVQEGAFVVTDSGPWRFYGLVTDLQLAAADERFAAEMAEKRFTPILSKLLRQETLFTRLMMMPALMLERGPDLNSPEYPIWRELHKDQRKPIPVKTVPAHHAPVRLADAADITEIFGEENNKEMFRVGETREQAHPICINLKKFVQRSSGIFGTTGSGKSFLTRMILAGLIHADHASTLIFDMHNEYGPDSTSSDTGAPVPGLRGKFPGELRLVGLGAGTAFGQLPADFNLEIPYSELTPEDILLLGQVLNLRETTAQTLSALHSQFGQHWFREFMALKLNLTQINDEGKKVPAPGSVAYWAESANINVLAAEALHGKLQPLVRKAYLAQTPAENALQKLVEALKAGKHVVLSFGNFDSDLDYLLVTNLITRKIRDTWEAWTNEYHRTKTNEPRPLVVAVEEAHKLLNREMATQTIFSTIARELRKYYVTLLIIDQRPSQIYDEVMSQLGTRISGALGDESDIEAVLSGLAGRQSLRGMLAKLQPKEEVLMLGWGVPMPIPIRSRRYDEKFWKELLSANKTDKQLKAAKSMIGLSDDSD
ncbi:MAG: ATP-binding protein [Anaerolineaceae bacterium]|nr:ATP-binding protein [Anaerolineaceae bacterium]